MRLHSTADAWVSFVKIRDLSQTTYAGIARIRFKGTPQGADLSLSAPPVFMSVSQYSRQMPKVKP